MIISIFIGIIGILFLLIPHFSLPLRFIKGASGALILNQCSIWYHPEIYLGLGIIGSCIFSLKNRKYHLLTAVFGTLSITHSFLLRPVSYYLQSEEPIVILSQTISLRAHNHILPVLLSLSLLITVLSVYVFFHKKIKKKIDITPYYIATTVIKRRLFRSASIIISLTIIIGAFFSDIFLIRSIENTLELGVGRLGADLMIVPRGEEKSAQTVLLSGGPTIFFLQKEILNTLKTFPEVEKISPQLYVQPFSYKVCCIVEDILIIAYDPLTDFTVAPWIQYSLKEEQQPYELAVGKLVKFYPGQSIELFGRKLDVVTSLEPTGLGYFDNSAFIPLEGARSLLKELKVREQVNGIPTRQKILDESFSHLFVSDTLKKIAIKDIDPDGISALFVKVKDTVSIKSLSKKIEKNFDTVSVINVKESTITVKRHLSSMLHAFLLPILIIMFMGTFILSFIFSLTVNERQREIGLLRAVGAKKKDIKKIILYEATILSSIGGIFGVLFGGSLIFLFKNQIMAALDLLYIWPSPRIIFTVLVLTVITSLLIGIMAALYPALRAGNMEPYHAIRSGE